MTGYITIDKDLENDPRVLALTDLYVEFLTEKLGAKQDETDLLSNACRNALLGALVTLWGYADTHLRDDDTLPITLRNLAPIVRLPEKIIRKFPSEWLTIRDDGSVQLPDYTIKNALNAKEKRREQGRDRARRFRARHTTASNAESNALHVTQDVTDVTRYERDCNDGRNGPPLSPPHTPPLTPPPNPTQPYSETAVGVRKGKKSRTTSSPDLPLPSDFALTEERKAFALARLPDADVPAMFEKFLARHTEKGTLSKNWDASWRTWALNALEYGYPRAKGDKAKDPKAESKQEEFRAPGIRYAN